MKDKASDKKLVQARLPFKTLSPHSTGVDKGSIAKKRKLSNAGQEEEEVIKKVFVKENIANSADVEIIEDDSNGAVEKDKSLINPVVRIVDNVDELIQQAKDKAEHEDSNNDSSSNKSKTESVICIDEISEDSSESKDESDSSQKLDNSIVDAKNDEDDTKGEKTNETSVNTPTQTKKSSKQLQRQQESAKKKEEKDKARQEQKRLKQEEKELRLKQKLENEERKKKEKEQKEEQRRKEKEDKERQKRLEKEEREKKRLSEIELKNEERRLKEEDKRKKEELKEEERKKKELEKEEAEQKQRKAAAAFANFFQKKVVEDSIVESKTDEKVTEKEQNNFMPFCLKVDMKLAPVNRLILNEDSKARLDAIINSSVEEPILYTTAIKDPNYKKGRSSKTWNNSEKDIIIIEEGEAIVESDTPKQQHSRPKLLQFHENRRPPYWGTWTKCSDHVKPRAPFGRDKILDYEVDSDSEWEEEEPGESLHGSDDEKEKDESEDDYEVDNDFFVPHGYLSEEEQNDAEEIESNSAEDMKVKLKLLQNEFNEEMKKKTEKIKPRLYGCIWSNADGSKPEKCVESIWNMLNQYSMIYDKPLVLKPEVDSSTADSDAVHTGPGCKLTKFPDNLLPDLIRLIHGNEYSRLFLIKEFYTYVKKNIEKQDISKSSIGRKIHEIAKYKTVQQDNTGLVRRCWFVAENYRQDHKLTDLPLVNQWEYSLKHKKLEKNLSENSPITTKKKIDKTNLNISKFTKVLDNDELAKQFKPAAEVKKRVALVSVPVGSKFPNKTSSENVQNKTNAEIKKEEKPPSTKSRVNLLTSFINRAETKYAKEAESGTETAPQDHNDQNEDCIMLSD